MLIQLFLGRDQRVAGLLQHLAIGGAGLAADIHERQADHVLHLRHDVDLADKLFGRVEPDRGGVDVAVIDRGVHDDAGRAPLPRHGVFPARIPGHVHATAEMLPKFSISGMPGFISRPFSTIDRHVAVRGHHDVEPVPAGLDLGQRGVFES
jgi:hypothetical protein